MVTVSVILMTPLALVAVVSVAYTVRKGEMVFIRAGSCPPNRELKALVTIALKRWNIVFPAVIASIRLAFSTRITTGGFYTICPPS